MAQKISINPGVRSVISLFAENLTKQGIGYDRIILFGSQAKKTARPDSDIDLCVVSRKFGKDYHEELVALIGAANNLDANIEAIPYHPEDLKDKYDPLASEIRAHGIPVDPA